MTTVDAAYDRIAAADRPEVWISLRSREDAAADVVATPFVEDVEYAMLDAVVVEEAAAPAPAEEPSTFTPLDVRALRIRARPLICADCRKDRLISRFSMLPFVDLITAGGCRPVDGTDAAATGMMPSALSAFRELTGSCTGTAVLLAEEGWA